MYRHSFTHREHSLNLKLEIKILKLFFENSEYKIPCLTHPHIMLDSFCFVSRLIVLLVSY